MTMVETVARAIYEGRNGAGCRPWSRLPRSHREPYLADVRAVVQALREPTQLQVQRGGTVDWMAFETTDAYVANVWREMIDALLAERPAAEGEG